MRKFIDNTYTDMAKIINQKINAYFIILLIMFILSIFMLRNISNQIYWHDKITLEAMACVEDPNCNIDVVLEKIEQNNSSTRN